MAKLAKLAGIPKLTPTTPIVPTVFSEVCEWREVCSSRISDNRNTMSCRIDRLVGEDHLVVLCISGRIRAQDLDMLRDLLGQESGAVAIDLKSVLLVDREVIKLLAFSEANGIELRNCPAYIREWIARERAQTDANRSEQGTAAREDVEDV